MNIKIFCRCSLFPSWSGEGLISTPVVTRLRAGGSGVQFLAGALDISSETSRPSLGPTQPSDQWISVRWREADHSLVPRLWTSGAVRLLPPVCLHGMYRDNFTFTFCVTCRYRPLSREVAVLWRPGLGTTAAARNRKLCMWRSHCYLLNAILFGATIEFFFESRKFFT